MKAQTSKQLATAVLLALLAGQASAGFLDGLTNAVNTVAGGLTTATNAVGSGLNTATNAVGSGLNTATNAVGSGLNTATNTVSGGLNTANKAVSGALNTADKTVVGALATARNVTTTGIQKGVNASQLLFGNVRSSVETQFQNIQAVVVLAAADFRNNLNFSQQFSTVQSALEPGYNQLVSSLVYTEALASSTASQIRNGSATLEDSIVGAIQRSRGNEVAQAIQVALVNDTAGLAVVPDQNLTQAVGFTTAATIARAENVTLVPNSAFPAVNASTVAATFVNGLSDTLTPCAATVTHTPGESTADFQRAVAAKCCYLVRDSLTNSAILTQAQGYGNAFMSAVMGASDPSNSTAIPLSLCFNGVSVS